MLQPSFGGRRVQTECCASSSGGVKLTRTGQRAGTPARLLGLHPKTASPFPLSGPGASTCLHRLDQTFAAVAGADCVMPEVLTKTSRLSRRQRERDHRNDRTSCVNGRCHHEANVEGSRRCFGISVTLPYHVDRIQANLGLQACCLNLPRAVVLALGWFSRVSGKYLASK